MKLFKYELKKNILRLPVLLLFAALILVSLYKHSETVQLYAHRIILPTVLCTIYIRRTKVRSPMKKYSG